MGTLVPPRDKVLVYGDGNTKVSIMDEDDVATYTIKTIDDPQTLNKTLKISISKEDFLASMKGMDCAGQVGVGHFYHISMKALDKLRNRKGREKEASKLYPEVKYTRMDEYLKVYA
ncbi:hypothetical protein M0R45_025332 [Rubus argutus]|uniref:Uncharacterized protein n=1 Tax=Rubus argutus TaxID=59490 RepID=A0AAW1WUE8_RUBAR